MKHTYTITGMTCAGCASTVKDQLEQHPEISEAKVDIKKNQATIQMSTHLPLSELQNQLGQNTVYSIRSLVHDVIRGDTKHELESYRPLVLIFLFIFVVTVICATDDGHFDLMLWMNYFMAGFFIVFSFFKFLDLRGFADGYSMYDLLAKRVKTYGFVYPFIELALGFAYLTQFAPKPTYIVTIIVMGFSSIGVIQSVLDKRKIRCACLGAVFNLPMSTVTIIEDLLMVGMAAFMLLLG